MIGFAPAVQVVVLVTSVHAGVTKVLVEEGGGVTPSADPLHAEDLVVCGLDETLELWVQRLHPVVVAIITLKRQVDDFVDIGCVLCQNGKHRVV